MPAGVAGFAGQSYHPTKEPSPSNTAAMPATNPIIAADRQDAERYRHLRNNAQWMTTSPYCLSSKNNAGHQPEILSEEELDDEVDAAMVAYNNANPE